MARAMQVRLYSLEQEVCPIGVGDSLYHTQFGRPDKVAENGPGDRAILRDWKGFGPFSFPVCWFA